MVTTTAAERFLRAGLLGEVEAESRRAIVNVLVEERADTGTTLMEQGRPNDRIRYLIDGSVAVVRISADGRVENVATLVAPSFFGETSYFRQVAPIVTVRALTPVWLLSLDHAAHERLRRENLKAAEELALAAARVLAERFDMLDKRISDYMAEHPDGHPRATEWANFRARLFEGASL
jgi:CRP-like cAMP-binding protein